MAKDPEAAIVKFLKSAKVYGHKSDSILIQSAENAIRARRKGDKTEMAKNIKLHLREIKDMRIFDEKDAGIYAKALDGLIKKLGYFSYGAAIKKRSSDFAKAIGLFKKKGAPAVQQQLAKIHADMVKSGELPDNSKVAELERQIRAANPKMGRFSLKEAEVQKQVNVAPVVIKFGFQRKDEASLRNLAKIQFKNGADSAPAKKAAQKFLNDMGNTKVKVGDLTREIDSVVMDAII